jgi:hypothetical protein
METSRIEHVTVRSAVIRTSFFAGSGVSCLQVWDANGCHAKEFKT